MAPEWLTYQLLGKFPNNWKGGWALLTEGRMHGRTTFQAGGDGRRGGDGDGGDRDGAERAGHRRRGGAGQPARQLRLRNRKPVRLVLLAARPRGHQPGAFRIVCAGGRGV